MRQLLLIVVSIGLVGVSLLAFGVLDAGEDQGGVRFLPPGEPPSALQVEQERSLEEITAKEVCEFHAALLRKCMESMPRGKNRHLSYDGLVATHDGDNRIYDENCELLSYRGGQWLHGSIGDPLRWTLHGDGPTEWLDVWLSLQKTEQTVCEWKSSKRTLHVNVSSMPDDWKSVDEPRPELSNHSVTDFLRLTNLPAPDEADEPE